MDIVNWKPLLHAGEVVLHLLPIGTTYSYDRPKGSPCVLPLFGYSADSLNTFLPFKSSVQMLTLFSP